MPNIRPLESISVRGYEIPAHSSVLLKPCKKVKSIKGGFLRAHNTSDTPQTLMPSQAAQRQWPEFTPEIEGDEKLASMPMAWNNPLIRFEIITLPHSLLPGGDRILVHPDAFTTSGSTWTMIELVSAVAAPPGSKPPGADNPGNYMGYDRTNWQVFQQETQNGPISDVDVIVAHGQLVSDYTTNADETAYIFETLDRNIAFVVSTNAVQAYTPRDDSLAQFLDIIGTSGCISLIQKAIRRRPRAMKHPDTGEEYETIEIVKRIAERFCRGYQSGFFLPNVGKFVTGVQHFLKRLFVIAAEDSEYHEKVMFDLSMAALLASLQPLWTPSEADILRFVRISCILLESPLTSHYDTSKDWPVVDDFQRAAPCLVQASMGGMTGDQRMLRWLALHPDDCNRMGTLDTPLIDQVDPLDVYCDQHQDGRLACLLEASGSIGETLSRAFFAVSGFNTRRHPVTERTREQQMVFDALRASSQLQRGIVPTRPGGSGPNFSYTLADGALAGMVGTIEIAHERGKYFVTVSTRNILEFIVIPKPSRDNKKGLQDITPDQKQAVVAKAKSILAKGRRVTNAADEAFRGRTIHLTDEGWTIHGRPWSEEKTKTFPLALSPAWHELIKATVKPVSWSSTFGQGKTFSPEVRQFALGRMAGYSPLITIPKINREGKGTDEALCGLEAEAFQYLSHLSEFFPDAIWPSGKKAFAFESASVAFRRELCEHLRNTITIECQWPAWSSQLSLRNAQIQALQEMMTQHAAGLASFLWMLVGQGKTLTVLRFLQETRSAKYIVWSLPKSAVSSVAAQIAEVGWHPVQMYSTRGTLKKHKIPTLDATVTRTMEADKVYLVEHDHLLKVVDDLAGQMNQTAFVFDEVHKAMQSGTKRTASALRLARIAKQLIALTGTPIVDKSGYGLMQWLRLCVPFPVSSTNLWVAMNSMVSPLNTGDVKTTDIVVQARETDDDRAFFKANFPKRAPWHGNTDTPTSDQWRDMRLRTNRIVTSELVRMAAYLVRRRIVDTSTGLTMDWRAEHGQACERDKLPGDHDGWDQHSQRPLVVASDLGHVVEIVNGLIAANVAPADILCVGGTRPNTLPPGIRHEKTIHLTEQAVMTGQEPPYKVVVAAQRYCEGYSLTWMTCMFTGAYPSNQASRTQMRGRINRLDAQRLYKRYYTVLTGVTTITYRYQEAAKMMEDALRNTAASRSAKKRKTYKMLHQQTLIF